METDLVILTVILMLTVTGMGTVMVKLTVIY